MVEALMSIRNFDLRRREFIIFLGSVAAAWPVTARAQSAGRMRRIGMLMNFPGGDPEAPIRVAAFLQRLQELGWTDRRDVQIDYRLADGDNEQRRVVTELISLAPDLLVVNGTAMLKAVQQATKSIPILFVNVVDPVGQGFIESLEHPGDNITGLSNVGPEMGAKWLQLLKEIAPQVKQIAIVGATTLSGASGIETTIRATAPSLGVKVIPFTARVAAEIEHAIHTLGTRPSLLGPQPFDVANTGLVVLPGAITRGRREQIISLAARGQLPAIYPYRYYVTGGGLLSYGVDTVDAYRRAAVYADRIFKGEKPADLPVQQDSKFELVINLRTAAQLGLEVPDTLRMRADELIGRPNSF
jgi:putative tryptophan/tyrosine transport system substrate-binding protein